MAYVMKKHLAHRSNYGDKRSTSDIAYIAIHFTANDGDHDEGNANYFASPRNPKASAHYFVDDDSVTQSVPDDYVAYSVGGSKYTDCAKTGGGKLYGISTNRNTLNIEMCDAVKDGTIKAQEATIVNTILLVRKKMKKMRPKKPVQLPIRFSQIESIFEGLSNLPTTARTTVFTAESAVRINKPTAIDFRLKKLCLVAKMATNLDSEPSFCKAAKIRGSRMRE